MERVRLGDLGNIITGNTPSKNNKEYYENGKIPFIKPNNFYTEKITNLEDANEYLSEEGSKIARFVEKDAVLITCIGSIGNVGIAMKKICFNQQINAIIPDNKIVNNRYLAYLLIKNKNKLKSIANAPVVPIINKTQFSNIEVIIHSIDEQNKIVKILDKIQSLIDKRKEQIVFFDILIKSRYLREIIPTRLGVLSV